MWDHVSAAGGGLFPYKSRDHHARVSEDIWKACYCRNIGIICPYHTTGCHQPDIDVLSIDVPVRSEHSGVISHQKKGRPANVRRRIQYMMKNLKIAIGADHAGFELKTALMDWLSPQVEVLKNMGTDSTESVDYPDFAQARPRH